MVLRQRSRGATMSASQVSCAVAVTGQGLYLHGDNLIELTPRHQHVIPPRNGILPHEPKEHRILAEFASTPTCFGPPAAFASAF